MDMHTNPPRQPDVTRAEDLHTAHKIETAITINKSPEEIYNFWRDFDNLPKFMGHVKSVEQIDSHRSRWRVQTLARRELEWEAEIIEDHRNEMISWRTVGDPDVPQAGSVWFREAPHQQGTEVRVIMKYDPPGGLFGEWIASLFGQDAETAIREDLHRLKAYLETGEIPTIEGQPSGREPQHEIKPEHFRKTWSQHSEKSSSTHH